MDAPATDPLAFLRSMRIDLSLFEGNRSTVPEWVLDGRILLASRGEGDAKLMARLAASTHKVAGRHFEKPTIDIILRAAKGHLRRRLVALAVWSRPDATPKKGPVEMVRLGLDAARPVADVHAGFLRLVEACLGGWDEITWQGEASAHALISFWKGGRRRAVLAPWADGDLPEIPADRLLAGADSPPAALSKPFLALSKPDFYGPTWPNVGSGGLDLVATQVGGIRSPRRGFRWALPTRAGVLRVGLDPSAKEPGPFGAELWARFDEPLRAARFLGGSVWFSRLHDFFHFRDGLTLWEFLQGQQLAQAPEDRPRPLSLAAPPPPLLDRRFVALFDPTQRGVSLYDAEHGRFLRGAFPILRGGMDRADMLCNRLHEASWMVQETRTSR